MKLFLKLSFFIFSALLCTEAAAKVQVFARVDSSEGIYVGENFAYHIVIEGAKGGGEVDLSALAEYSPQSSGSRDLSQNSITIINGKTTRKEIKRYVMSYSLTAVNKGLVRLGPVTVKVGEKTYRTNAVELNILEPKTTENLKIRVILSETQCYVGQPVMMTVELQISTRVRDAGFNVPVFSERDFHIEDVAEAKGQWAQADHVVNGISIVLNERREVIDGVETAIISFTKVLIPKHSGEVVIEAVSVSAQVAVGVSRSRDRFFGQQYDYDRFMATSEAHSLKVLELPEEGRPDEFYGLVGRYSISASAVPRKVNVGDPITLTIKVGRSRYLKPVQWPVLEDVGELAANFKIPSQKASPTIEDGYKVFTQTIRVNNDNVKAIPSIPLAFFDPQRGKYFVAKSDPIELDVAETKILSSADLEGRDITQINKEVEAIKKGLSANYEGGDVLADMSFSPVGAAFGSVYSVLWMLPLAGLIVSCLIKLLTHTTPEKVALKRRRQARSKAIGKLKGMRGGGSQLIGEELVEVMKRYIGDRFDRTAGSLTGDDCYEVIVDATGEEGAAEKYRDIISRCEAGRYAFGQASVGEADIVEAIGLIQGIEKRSGK